MLMRTATNVLIQIIHTRKEYNSKGQVIFGDLFLKMRYTTANITIIDPWTITHIGNPLIVFSKSILIHVYILGKT